MRAEIPLIIDAHLDLAYNALYKQRDYRCSAYATRRKEDSRSDVCTVGLPELIRGRVGIVFATLFVEPYSRKLAPGLPAYRSEHEAHRLAMAQLDFYRRWADVDPHVRLITNQAELRAHVDAWMHPVPGERHRVGMVVLMEGADPILEPKELER